MVHSLKKMPLYPSVADEQTEIPIRGMVAMALNGVPTYGPQEAGDFNALEGDNAVRGANFWYGHAGSTVCKFFLCLRYE